jgi:hypothetical protein
MQGENHARPLKPNGKGQISSQKELIIQYVSTLESGHTFQVIAGGNPSNF